MVYIILTDHLQGSFSINEVTGTITSTSPLHSQDSYIISVVASDQGTPPMSRFAAHVGVTLVSWCSLISNTTVAITVTAIYDATPNFSLPGYVFNVNEDASVNTRLEGISAAAGVGVSIVYSTDFSGMGEEEREGGREGGGGREGEG